GVDGARTLIGYSGTRDHTDVDPLLIACGKRRKLMTLSDHSGVLMTYPNFILIGGPEAMLLHRPVAAREREAFMVLQHPSFDRCRTVHSPSAHALANNEGDRKRIFALNSQTSKRTAFCRPEIFSTYEATVHLETQTLWFQRFIGSSP